MADLSEETLESLTDEVKSSGSFSSSGGLQPSSSAFGSKSESGSQPSRSEYGDHQSELSDFKANVKKLSRKWIHNLKGKETNSEQYRPDPKYQTEITQASLEELNALQSFCTVKVNLIHHRANSTGKKSSRHKKLQLGPEAEAPEVDTLKCTVPDELLNRIYFKNMRTPKQPCSMRDLNSPSKEPGSKTMPPALGAWSVKHWTARAIKTCLLPWSKTMI
ncbi:hypothetical protein AB1E18_018532 [Capra hircus]